MVGLHSVVFWFSLETWPTVRSNDASMSINILVDLCSVTTLTTTQQKVDIFTIGGNGLNQSVILEYPKDARSVASGSIVCGEITLTFLDKTGNVFDLSTSSFLRFESPKLTVQSQSFADIGEYEY